MFKININALRNYTYSYYGGLVAALGVAFMLGQNPINYGIPVLIYLLVGWLAGALGVIFLEFAIYLAESLKKAGSLRPKASK